MRFRNDPDGDRLPIKIDTATNGEFIPQPLAEHNLAANSHALEQANANAKYKNALLAGKPTGCPRKPTHRKRGSPAHAAAREPLPISEGNTGEGTNVSPGLPRSRVSSRSRTDPSDYGSEE